MSDLIPLPELGAALMAAYGTPSPGYQYVHRMITKGVLTPERLGGRGHRGEEAGAGAATADARCIKVAPRWAARG
jgi:hypothetical protein